MIITIRLRLDDELLHAIARTLTKHQSQGICDRNYPAPCDMCDCYFGPDSQSATIASAKDQARAVMDVLRDAGEDRP